MYLSEDVTVDVVWYRTAEVDGSHVSANMRQDVFVPNTASNCDLFVLLHCERNTLCV